MRYHQPVVSKSCKRLIVTAILGTMMAITNIAVKGPAPATSSNVPVKISKDMVTIDPRIMNT